MDDDPDDVSLYSTETRTLHRSPSSDISDAMSLEDDADYGVRVPEANFSPNENSRRLLSTSEVFDRADVLPPQNFQMANGLRSIKEIPERYRVVFSDYPCFNRIQSQTMDVVYYSDEPLVVTAPTGSGKTVIFELAIIRLLMAFEKENSFQDFKIVYMAPVKALCSEKLHDWAHKFSKLKVNCLEVTGDTDIPDLNYLNKHQLILTTPEKWDSLTRRWRDHLSLMQTVRLFLIDEVHILNEESRGPTLEAVVSRMKMLKMQQLRDDHMLPTLRFIAVSATLPNIEDLSEWLGSIDHPAKFFKIDEDMRPVKLQKIVKGYDSNAGGYQFDIHLSYKLKFIISQYSSGKPTLVFCSTRKSVMATANVLCKTSTFSFSPSQKDHILSISQHISESMVKDLFEAGIGCHHAGLLHSDRILIEDAFRAGALPVLIATSTLAMGVNLPAHLVVIKTTQFYGPGGYQDYSDSQILQMMGRAGRPQFDTSAVCVIMTKASCEERYRRLVAGRDPIQSSLHRHLAEHLNAEVVLGTVRDLPGAVEWMRSTFLFVRALRSPEHYGLAPSLASDPDRAKINTKLQELVKVELNALARYRLVETNGVDVRETPAGRLMARYYIAFDTMKIFLQIKGDEGLGDLLVLLSQAAEFQDVQVRNDEKRSLNALNSSKQGGPGLRFPIKGRIKGRDDKVNCLLQAVLGGLTIHEPSLQQEANRVLRVAERLARCLLELVSLQGGLSALLGSVLLSKCLRCRLWEDSPLAARQLPRIGPVLSQLLVAAGKTSLRDVAQSNPRDLERILNRLPPFGNELREAAESVPCFSLDLSLGTSRDQEVIITVSVVNLDSAVYDPKHWLILIAGDNNNNVLCHERLPCGKLLGGALTRRIDASNSSVGKITAHIISENWVGIDKSTCLTLRTAAVTSVPMKDKKKASVKKPSFMEQLKMMGSRMNSTPSVKLPYKRDTDTSTSERLQSFRKATAKMLPRSEAAGSELGDPLGDWDQPPDSDEYEYGGAPRTSTQSSSWSTRETLPSQGASGTDYPGYSVEERDSDYYPSDQTHPDDTYEKDPFDDVWDRLPPRPEVDGISTQTSSRSDATSMPSTSKHIEYSKRIRNQPTIRNYLIPREKVSMVDPVSTPPPGWPQSRYTDFDENTLEDPFAAAGWPDVDEPSVHALGSTSDRASSQCVPDIIEFEAQWQSKVKPVRESCLPRDARIENITFDIGIEELLCSSSDDEELKSTDAKLGLVVEDNSFDHKTNHPEISASLEDITSDQFEAPRETIYTQQLPEPNLPDSHCDQTVQDAKPKSCESLNTESLTESDEVVEQATTMEGLTEPSKDELPPEPACVTTSKVQGVSDGELSSDSDLEIIDIQSAFQTGLSTDTGTPKENELFPDALIPTAEVYCESREDPSADDGVSTEALHSKSTLGPSSKYEVEATEIPGVFSPPANTVDITRVTDAHGGGLSADALPETAKPASLLEPSENEVYSDNVSQSEGNARDTAEDVAESDGAVLDSSREDDKENSPSAASGSQEMIAFVEQLVDNALDGFNSNSHVERVECLPSAEDSNLDEKMTTAPDVTIREEVPHNTKEVDERRSQATAKDQFQARQDAETSSELNVMSPAPSRSVRQKAHGGRTPGGSSASFSRTPVVKEACEEGPCDSRTYTSATNGSEDEVTPPNPSKRVKQPTQEPNCPFDIRRKQLETPNVRDVRQHIKGRESPEKYSKFVMAPDTAAAAVHDDARRPLQFLKGAPRSACPVSEDILNILNAARTSQATGTEVRVGAVLGGVCRRGRNATPGHGGENPKQEGEKHEKVDFIERILAEHPRQKLHNYLHQGETTTMPHFMKQSDKNVLRSNSDRISRKKDDSSNRKPDFLDRLLAEPLKRTVAPNYLGVKGMVVSTKRKPASPEHAQSKGSPTKPVTSRSEGEGRPRFKRSPEARPLKFRRGNPIKPSTELSPARPTSFLEQLPVHSEASMTRGGSCETLNSHDTTKKLWGGQRGATVTRSGGYRPPSAENPKSYTRLDKLFQKILSRGGTNPKDISPSKEEPRLHSTQQYHSPCGISLDSNLRNSPEILKIMPSERLDRGTSSFERPSPSILSPESPGKFRESSFSSDGNSTTDKFLEKGAWDWELLRSESNILAHNPHIYETPKREFVGYTQSSPTPERTKPVQEVTPRCLSASLYNDISSSYRFPRRISHCSPERDIDHEFGVDEHIDEMDDEEWMHWDKSPDRDNTDTSYSPVAMQAVPSDFEWKPSSHQELSHEWYVFEEIRDGEFQERLSPHHSRRAATRTPLLHHEGELNEDASGYGPGHRASSNHSKKLVLALSPGHKTSFAPYVSKWDSFLREDGGEAFLSGVKGRQQSEQQSEQIMVFSDVSSPKFQQSHRSFYKAYI